MKRFYWLEVSSLFLSYILLINKIEILSLFVAVTSLIAIMLITKTVNLYRLSFISLFIFGFSMIISENGGLYVMYKYLDLVLAISSVNLALLYEILDGEDNFEKTFKPYCFMLLMSLLFFSTGIILSGCTIFDTIYPYGILSLFALIGIIFVPYLMTMTLSFVYHEYNY